MELIKLTASEFKKIARLIYDRTGIHLPDAKLTLLSNRLRRRLRVLGLDSFASYYDLLLDKASCSEELRHFLSAVTTNETYFFRNERLWKFFREQWIPEIVELKKGKGRSIQIWSAASSSGEEAYTAAICLKEELVDFSSWRVSVVGSDISQDMIDRARAGVYNDYAVAKILPATLRKWFDKRDDDFVLKGSIRSMVSFKFHNLREPFSTNCIDLVFLRNVLMYFDLEMKKRVLVNVAGAIAPGGRLIVGDVDPIRNTPELRETLGMDACGLNLYRMPDGTETRTKPMVAMSKGS